MTDTDKPKPVSTEGTTPVADALYLPKKPLSDFKEHEVAPDRVDAPVAIYTAVFAKRSIASQRPARMHFTLGFLYKLGGIDFNLIEQFVADHSNLRTEELDLVTEEYPVSLFDLPYDGNILQSMPTPVFKQFLTWMSMAAFTRESKSFWVAAKQGYILDPFSRSQVSGHAAVVVFTPECSTDRFKPIQRGAVLGLLCIDKTKEEPDVCTQGCGANRVGCGS